MFMFLRCFGLLVVSVGLSIHLCNLCQHIFMAFKAVTGFFYSTERH